MAKRNRKLRNELNELEQSERNLYLINSKNDNISNRMDGLSLREILPKTQAQSDTFDAYNEKYNLLLHGCVEQGKRLFLCILHCVKFQKNHLLISQ